MKLDMKLLSRASLIGPLQRAFNRKRAQVLDFWTYAQKMESALKEIPEKYRVDAAKYAVQKVIKTHRVYASRKKEAA